MNNSNKPPIDFEALKRAITLGSAEAARDAGLLHFVIAVSIEPACVETPTGPHTVPAIKVEIVELTEAEAAVLRGPEVN